MRRNITFQSFADSVVTDKELCLSDDMNHVVSENEINQRYPTLKGLISIMKPKINRVDKISTPSFIEDIFNDDDRFMCCLEMDIPDELIICLTYELYGVDTPEKLNDKQISIIKVLAVYIIISTYTV